MGGQGGHGLQLEKLSFSLGHVYIGKITKSVPILVLVFNSFKKSFQYVAFDLLYSGIEIRRIARFLFLGQLGRHYYKNSN